MQYRLAVNFGTLSSIHCRNPEERHSLRFRQCLQKKFLYAVHTFCPESRNPFYIANLLYKMGYTSLTYCIFRKICGRNHTQFQEFHGMILYSVRLLVEELFLRLSLLYMNHRKNNLSMIL